MKTSTLSKSAISITVASMFAACSAKAQFFNLAFDFTDSDLGAGIYAFSFTSGDSPANATVISGSLQLYYGALPQPYQSFDESTELQAGSSPTAWTATPTFRPGFIDDAGMTWEITNPSGVLNGVFYITGAPSLNGDLGWDSGIDYTYIGDSDSSVGTTENDSGYVTIVPESDQYGLVGSLALACVAISEARRRSRASQMRTAR
jgi:hypothetical protein